MSKKLNLHSFYLNMSSLPKRQLYFVQMPSSWRDFISQHKREGSYGYPFQLTTMGKKLESVMPGLISANFHHNVIDKGEPWLIAAEKIDLDIIRQMCLSWFLQQLKKKGMTKIAELPQEILMPLFNWELLPELEDLDRRYVYQVIPGLFAFDLCHHPIELTDKKGQVRTLAFNRGHASNFQELMTEPIKTAQGDYFSYVIRIQVVTRGGNDKQLLLNIKTGIRRFITEPLIKENKCFLPGGKKQSVYLSLENPYGNVIGFRSFAKLQIKRSNSSLHATEWVNDIDKIFMDLVMNKQAFNTDEILRDPEEYIKGVAGVNALVLYSTHTVRSSNIKVQVGAGLPERKEVFNAFKNRYPELQQLEPLAEVKVKSSLNAEPSINSRKPWLNNSQQLELEVWAVDKKFYYETLDQIQDIFELSTISANLEYKDVEHLIIEQRNAQPIKLTVKWCDGSLITSELEIDSLPPEAAAKKREKQIQNIIKKANRDNPIMAFVEIEDFRLNEQRENRDPKKAIRNGMLATERITQFVVEGDKNKAHRIKNGLYDLLADRGFIRENWHSLKSEAELIGVDIIKIGNENIPVLSWFHNQQVYIKFYGESQWLPMAQALTKIKELEPKKIALRNKAALLPYVTQQLKDVFKKTQSPIYVFAEAGLRNSWWKELQNGNINFAQLPFGGELSTEASTLRFVRVNNQSEVPYYDVLSSKEKIGRRSGLFKDQAGIYYSIGNRPDTMQVGVEYTKFDKPNIPIVKQQAVELIPLGCIDNDECNQLAVLAHELRRVNLTYEVHTALPIILHRFKALEKYLKTQEYSTEIDFEDIE